MSCASLPHRFWGVCAFAPAIRTLFDTEDSGMEACHYVSYCKPACCRYQGWRNHNIHILFLFYHGRLSEHWAQTLFWTFTRICAWNKHIPPFSDELFGETLTGSWKWILSHNLGIQTYVSLQLLVQNVVSAQPCVGKLGISLVLLNFLHCNFRLWFKTP